ncbi:MAG: mucoidy inhibitor MuiA family protein [Bacteroidia bacterium]|jgi:hypothetical protein|nr:mucoidy inhibitor MuiA family protein [Bacteroidia bacterium]
MKQFLLCLSLFVSVYSQAAMDTLRPKSRVSQVTVFFNGAQVTRAIELKLSPGSHFVLIESLPQEINANSIQVSSVNNCKILSVKHHVEQSNVFAPVNEKEINAKIKTQELKIKAIKNKQNVYEIEERILLDNSMLSKKEEGSSVAKLKEAGDFYRLRLNEIKQAKLDLSVELDAAEEKIKELYLQMNQTVSKKRLPSSSILITLDAERETNTVMNLSYYISSAGWEPNYDFRLEDISKPMQVVYNANVFQSSGENWENASLRLSTVDPSLSADKPQLEPWILGSSNVNTPLAKRREAGSIEGSLVDAATQEFLGNANVILQMGNKIMASGLTNAQGKFSFKPVPVGNYNIIFTYMGFQTINQNISVNANFTTNQTFYMQANTIAMREQPVPTFQQPVFVPQDNYAAGYRDVYGSNAPMSAGAYEGTVKNSNAEVTRVRTKKSKQPKQVEQKQVEENKPLVLDELYSSLKETLSDIEYSISLPYSIPSDGQDHVIRVKEMSIPARFVYHAVPKLETDVFLIAEIANWQQLKLLSGKASVYFEGTFTGQSYINSELSGDTLEISVGRDKDIVVKREGNKMLNDKKTSGNTVKETIAWDVSIKNNKKTPIVLVLEDQYPISQRKSVEVELLESSEAKVDKNTGELIWEMKVEAGEKKTITTKFSVKYPKQSGVVTD